VRRVGRGLAFFAMLGAGVLLTQVLTSLGSIVGRSVAAGALGVVAALALNVALFLAIFELLGPPGLTWHDHLPGAVVAGAGWQLLELAGQFLVQRTLRNATHLYGQFAVVLGLISFLSLASQLVMYAVEVNVVLHDRLWPRSMVRSPPGTAGSCGGGAAAGQAGTGREVAVGTAANGG
jgi:uncharacterized BrkB/YihY/UPF0761 family membrane protein